MIDYKSEDSYALEVSRRKFLRTGSTALAITALLGIKANAGDKKVIKNDERKTFEPLVSPISVSYGAETVDGLKIAYREAGKPGSPKLVAGLLIGLRRRCRASTGSRKRAEFGYRRRLPMSLSG
jgi:hypothetical protein